eukprot:32896-Pleurochrysis_carterae.AAC.1
MIKRGWIKKAEIDMMLVGHTHEDIDAVLRRIYELWKKKGGCLSPYAFKEMLQMAHNLCIPSWSTCTTSRHSLPITSTTPWRA